MRMTEIKGPWHVAGNRKQVLAPDPYGSTVQCVVADCRGAERFGPTITEHPQAEQHAKLVAASVESYRTHCGPRAIELAEGDLLGELIDFAEEALHIVECHAEFNETFAVKRGREILAKLPQPNGESHDEP